MSRFLKFIELLEEDGANQVLPLFDNKVFPKELRPVYEKAAERIHEAWNKTDKRLWEGSWYRLGELFIFEKSALAYKEGDGRLFWGLIGDDPDILNAAITRINNEGGLDEWRESVEKAKMKIISKTPFKDMDMGYIYQLCVTHRSDRMAGDYVHFSNASKTIPPIKEMQFERWRLWPSLVEEMTAMEEEYLEKTGKDEMLTWDDVNDDGDKLILKMSGGWEWWLHPEQECSSKEARIMKHCGNNYSERSDDEIYSLRKLVEIDGEDFWSPHLTFAVNNGVLRESKGRKNQKPSSKYLPQIFELLKTNHIEKIRQHDSYQPENNFQMEDLTVDQISEILSKKGVSELNEFESTGGNKELQVEKAQKWLDDKASKLLDRRAYVALGDESSWDDDSAGYDIGISFDFPMFFEEDMSHENLLGEYLESDYRFFEKAHSVEDQLSSYLNLDNLYVGFSGNTLNLGSSYYLEYDEEHDSFIRNDDDPYSRNLIDIIRDDVDNLRSFLTDGGYEKAWMEIYKFIRLKTPEAGKNESYDTIMDILDDLANEDSEENRLSIKADSERVYVSRKIEFDGYGYAVQRPVKLTGSLIRFLKRVNELTDQNYEKLIQLELPLTESVTEEITEFYGVFVNDEGDEYFNSLNVGVWIDLINSSESDQVNFEKMMEFIQKSDILEKFVQYVVNTMVKVPDKKTYLSDLENRRGGRNSSDGRDSPGISEKFFERFIGGLEEIAEQ